MRTKEHDNGHVYFFNSNMFSNLSKYLTSPPFENEEDQRNADILNSILPAILVGGITALVLTPLLAPQGIPNLIFVGIVFLILIATKVLMSRRHIHAASLLLVVSCWLVIVIACAVEGGIRSANFPGGMIVIITAAGLLLGWRGSIIFSVLGSLAGLFFVINERLQFINLPNSPIPTASLWIENTVYFIMTALLFGIAVQRIRDAFARVEESRNAVQVSQNMYRQAIAKAGAVPYFRDFVLNKYTFMGDGILQMTGYSASEITPEIWESLEQERFPRGKLSRFTYEEAEKLVVQNNSVIWECDYRILTREGETRWVSDTAVKSVNENGERIGVIGILQDITDAKNVLIERENLIKDLEARNAELERFTYTVSHDLKSPLVTILGYLGYVEVDMHKGNHERVSIDIQRIKTAAIRMQNLLQDLLELSRIGRITNPLEEVPLTEIIQEALSNVGGQLDNMRVTVEIGNDLPTVCVDKARLVEVFQNLVDNACKYMGEQLAPRIEIGKRDDEGETVFFVRDNGIGIEPQHHEKIFGLFNQLDPKSEGNGVGLSLVKRIIEMHGGRIWVESEGASRGAAFCFTLQGKNSKP